jgi:hypothetical protein
MILSTNVALLARFGHSFTYDKQDSALYSGDSYIPVRTIITISKLGCAPIGEDLTTQTMSRINSRVDGARLGAISCTLGG